MPDQFPMDTTPASTEHLATNARAYDASCIGCQKHSRDIMISFLPEKGGQIIDWFLRQEAAEFLHKELGEKLAMNKKPVERIAVSTPAEFTAHGHEWTPHTPGEPCPVAGEIANLRARLNEVQGHYQSALESLQKQGLIIAELRAALSGRTVSCGACNEMAKEIANLRATIKETHEVLDADASKIIRNAQDGYPEGREAKELTLAERVRAICKYAADWKRWCEDADKTATTMRAAIKEAHDALELCYDVTEYPANGESRQDKALAALQPFITDK